MSDDDGTEEESTPGDSSIPPETEDRIVNRVVAKVRDIVSEISGGGGRGGDTGESGEAPVSPPHGAAATEADMEGKVKAAVEKEITAKERARARAEERAAHDAEHERIRAIAEKPPKIYSRLTTALWGSDDQ